MPLILHRPTASITRTKERIQSTNEIFTPETLIDEMLTSLRDLDPTLYSNADKTFCDPACGDGNFLVRFLHWKWELNEERAGGWTPPIKRILRSIWGVDLMPDNVEVARSRLIELTASLTGNSFEKTAELYSHIVSHNVVCHDSLTWNFEEWRPPTEEEIEVLSAPPKKKRASRKSMSAFLLPYLLPNATNR